MNSKVNYKKTSLAFGLLVLSAFTLRTLITNTTKVKAATPCIVTIFGQQYDVSPLQTGHPGGNIFICGTDMTTIYQAQHGTDVSRLQPYIIIPPTSTPIPTSIPTSVPVSTITIVPTLTPTVPTITPTVPPQLTPTPIVDPQPAPGDEHEEEDDDENNYRDEESDDHEDYDSDAQDEEYEGDERDDDHQDDDDHDEDQNRLRNFKPRYKYQTSDLD